MSMRRIDPRIEGGFSYRFVWAGALRYNLSGGARTISRENFYLARVNPDEASSFRCRIRETRRLTIVRVSIGGSATARFKTFQYTRNNETID